MSFLNDATSSALEQALDTAALRQRTLAHNIANIDTPGFKRSTVRFEETLADALGEGGNPDERARRVSRTAPQVEQVETSLRADGNNVDIDMEAAELAENSLRYEAIAQMTSMRSKMLRTAIHEGRR